MMNDCIVSTSEDPKQQNAPTWHICCVRKKDTKGQYVDAMQVGPSSE